MESLNQRYAMLNIEVQTIFDNKYNYKDIDYIRIMNQLKEKYLKLLGTKEEPKRETLVDIESDNESDYQVEQGEDIEYDSDGYENYFSSY